MNNSKKNRCKKWNRCTLDIFLICTVHDYLKALYSWVTFLCQSFIVIGVENCIAWNQDNSTIGPKINKVAIKFAFFCDFKFWNVILNYRLKKISTLQKRKKLYIATSEKLWPHCVDSKHEVYIGCRLLVLTIFWSTSRKQKL